MVPGGRRRYIARLLLVGLVLSACAGTSTAESVDVAQPAAEAERDSSAGSPLEAKLGFSSEPGRRELQLIGLQQEADTQLGACMRSAGFFYVAPQVDEFVNGAVAGDGTRESVAANGLGITASFVRAVMSDTTGVAATSDETNRNYIASLTAEQAADYDRALIGVASSADDVGAYEPAGCWGDAFGPILERLKLVEEFAVEIDSLNTRFAADPRVRAHDSEWSACMELGGYRFSNENALTDDVYARLLGLEFVEVDGATRFASADAVDELLAYERGLGVASFDCRQDFAVELEQLRHDYEQEFLDDNRFRIADLLEG